MLDLFRQLVAGTASPFQALAYIFSSMAVILLTLPIHEFAHGFVSDRLGDPTARYQGRLTLNPLAHIDYLGAACILLFGFGWAKPVQVNSRNFKNPKRDMALTALAGPVSNLIVALIAMLALNALNAFAAVTLGGVVYYIMMFFSYIAYINIYLAVFNLIPIPPLDGSRLLSALLPYRQYYALMRYERYIFWGILVLIWFGVLNVPLSFLSNRIYSGINYLTALPFSFLN